MEPRSPKPRITPPPSPRAQSQDFGSAAYAAPGGEQVHTLVAKCKPKKRIQPTFAGSISSNISSSSTNGIGAHSVFGPAEQHPCACVLEHPNLRHILKFRAAALRVAAVWRELKLVRARAAHRRELRLPHGPRRRQLARHRDVERKGQAEGWR